MKKHIPQLLAFACLVMVYCSCKSRITNGNSITSSSDNLSDITLRIDTADGFKDIFLRIVTEVKTDSSHIYIAKGLYKTDTVGLQIEVKSGQCAGISSDAKDPFQADGFSGDGIKFKSIGQQSNNFVHAMGNIYEFPTSKPFTSQTITATDFSMNEAAVDLDKKEDYQFKLFLAEDDTILSSELYLNVNLKKREIGIKEKDEGYRESLMKIWTE